MEPKQFVGQLLVEWQNNRRFRLACGLAVSLAFLSIFLFAHDKLDVLQKDLDERKVILSEMRSLKSIDYWKQENQNAAAQLERLEAMLWKGPTKSRVKVNAQSELLSIARSAGIIRPQIKSADVRELKEISNHFSVQISLEGLYENDGFVRLLKQIESSHNRIVLDKLRVATAPRLGSPGRLEMIGTVFFVLD